MCEYLIISAECTISWVPYDSTTANPLPASAVTGGKLDDIPLYVARKSAEHKPNNPIEYSSGYYDNVNDQGHLPYGGLDIVYNDVELLVLQG